MRSRKWGSGKRERERERDVGWSSLFFWVGVLEKDLLPAQHSSRDRRDRYTDKLRSCMG